uniref:helix-turn-helix domain-containing protein n=1 Tax=Nocardia concava TaxID=257281 RepID=UPI00059391DC
MTGSTMGRRALGRELKRLRENKKMRPSETARVIGVSPQTVGRLEDGLVTKVSDLYINALCDAYGATDEERRVLLDLALEIRTTQKSGGGWWRSYMDEMHEGFDHYMGLEDAARKVSVWKVTLIPGLLQTPEYRRAIAWIETPGAPTEQVERRLEMAVRRQARLEDPGFAVEVVLSEMTLRDRIGGAGVMADQLHRLAEVAQLPNVEIRVVPFATSGCLGSRTGSFVLLEFPKLPAT